MAKDLNDKIRQGKEQRARKEYKKEVEQTQKAVQKDWKDEQTIAFLLEALNESSDDTQYYEQDGVILNSFAEPTLNIRFISRLTDIINGVRESQIDAKDAGLRALAGKINLHVKDWKIQTYVNTGTQELTYDEYEAQVDEDDPFCRFDDFQVYNKILTDGLSQHRFYDFERTRVVDMLLEYGLSKRAGNIINLILSDAGKGLALVNLHLNNVIILLRYIDEACGNDKNTLLNYIIQERNRQKEETDYIDDLMKLYDKMGDGELQND